MFCRCLRVPTPINIYKILFFGNAYRKQTYIITKKNYFVLVVLYVHICRADSVFHCFLPHKENTLSAVVRFFSHRLRIYRRALTCQPMHEYQIPKNAESHGKTARFYSVVKLQIFERSAHRPKNERFGRCPFSFVFVPFIIADSGANVKHFAPIFKNLIY